MLYIYSKNEVFESFIDKSSFFKELDKNKYFTTENYIETWKETFNFLIDDDNNKKCYINNELNFYYSIFINKKEFRFHFDIDKALSFKNRLSEYVSLNCFSERAINNSFKIRYTSTNINTEYNYCQCNKPVIVVPFPYAGFPYLLIDGNHRVTEKKIAGEKNILVNELTPNETFSLLQTKLEQALYIFLFEQTNISYYLENSKAKLFLM